MSGQEVEQLREDGPSGMHRPFLSGSETNRPKYTLGFEIENGLPALQRHAGLTLIRDPENLNQTVVVVVPDFPRLYFPPAALCSRLLLLEPGAGSEAHPAAASTAMSGMSGMRNRQEDSAPVETSSR